MWEFLRWILDGFSVEINAKLDQVLNHQHQILTKQEETKVIIMAVRDKLIEHATKVNAFSDQIAAAIEGVRQDIADLKAKLVDASTPEEVDEILAPVDAKLEAQANALTALDAENVPAVPPPPVEPPPVEPGV